MPKGFLVEDLRMMALRWRVYLDPRQRHSRAGRFILSQRMLIALIFLANSLLTPGFYFYGVGGVEALAGC